MEFKHKERIIFVGGIHGVGKTTLCNSISESLMIKHYSASKLISNLKAENDEGNKRVKNIKENQDLLMVAINEYIDSEEYYLLDGHFCLLNSNDIVTKIPMNTFKSLGIKCVIVLEDDDIKILERLNQRDKKHYSLALIHEFQQAEIMYAKEVASNIGTELKVFNMQSDVGELISFIEKNISD